MRNISIITIAILTTIFGCGKMDKNKTEIKEELVPKITKSVVPISATKDQKKRRLNSESICKLKEIPVYKNPNSLFVESEDNVKLRTKDEVVDRAIALLYLGLKSEGLEKNKLDKVFKKLGVESKITPVEKKYVFAVNPTEQEKANANWRYESLHVLLWSLGYIEKLEFPDKICNVSQDVKIIYTLGLDKFKENAKLRSKKEILDQADLILRLNWACTNARIKNEEPKGNLNASVVYERHYSLNWLIRYMNQNWDNISTDT